MFIFKEKRGVAVKLMEKQNVLKLTRFKKKSKETTNFELSF